MNGLSAQKNTNIDVSAKFNCRTHFIEPTEPLANNSKIPEETKANNVLMKAQRYEEDGEFEAAATIYSGLVEEGVPEAMYAQALLLYNGQVTPQDSSQADFLMNKAADKGNAAAINYFHTRNNKEFYNSERAMMLSITTGRSVTAPPVSFISGDSPASSYADPLFTRGYSSCPHYNSSDDKKTKEETAQDKVQRPVMDLLKSMQTPLFKLLVIQKK
jgi:TPR repeat protein